MQNIDPLLRTQNQSETADYVVHFNMRDRYRLVRQGVFNYVGQIASILSSLVLVPFMLQRLGAEAYGFWIVALATPAFVSGIDNALSLAVIRECALHNDQNRITDEETSSFLSACCGVYVSLGLLCGFLIVATGIRMVPHLHLSPNLQGMALKVFVAVAIVFAAGRAVTFASGVLAGFQRFGTINTISVFTLLVRTAGFLLLLMRHAPLATIAVWYAAVGVVECIVALAYAYRLGAVRADRSLLQWRPLLRSVDFGISSFLTTQLLNLCSFGPAVLVGIFGGGARSTMTLYAGQRPCLIVSELNWRGGEVLFSMSAAQEKRKVSDRNSSLMVFGTTWLLAVAMPLCIGLFILAPVLVSVWLRISSPEIVTVMRLTSIGVIADALWVGPLHALWGHGLARRVLLIAACVTGSVFLLDFLLIPRFGAPGAALAFTTSAWIGAMITTTNAANEINSSWLKLLVSSFSDLALPSATLTLFVLATSNLLRDYPRSLLLVATIGGGIVYVMLFEVQQRFQKRSLGSLFRSIGKQGDS